MIDRAQQRYLLTGVTVGLVALLGGLLLLHLRGSFTIDGNAATAAPRGMTVPLDLTFTNKNGFPISVTDVKVTVRYVNGPHVDPAHRCTARDFVVEQLSSRVRVTVGAHRSRSLSELQVPDENWPEVRLVGPTSDHDCRGASVTFNYTASRSLKLW